MTPWRRITKEEAVESARAEAERRGWPLQPEITVERFLLRYYVRTNHPMRGGNVNMTVSARTGEVIRAAFARR